MKFGDQMGVTFPILYDEGSKVMNSSYVIEYAIHSVYPKDWIVGVDGRIVYANNTYDSEEIMAVLDAELAKEPPPRERGP